MIPENSLATQIPRENLGLWALVINLETSPIHTNKT